MRARTKDRLGSVLLLIFVAILWVQRDYTTPMGGIFPDRIMLILAALLVVGLVLSFTCYAAIKEEGEKKEAAPKNWRDLIVVIVGLLLWTGLLRSLGFALTGVVGFAGMSWYLSGRYRDPRTIVTCLAIGAAVTYLFVLIFGHLLQVPLPKGKLFE